MTDVEGKVAFITGGSSGIGLGIARVFADAGMKVAIGYRTKEHLEESMAWFEQAGGAVHAINVDVTDRPGMERAAEETVQVFGKVHVLVNNAGVVHPSPLSNTTYDDWDWIMDVNLNGVFNGVHAFLPHIRAHGQGGHITTTASIMGLFFAGRGQVAYTASKFAVVGMMEALRAELADTNIGVSVFCPGLVSSNIMDSGRNRPPDLASTRFKVDPELAALERAARQNPEFAMDSLEAGQLLLRGMRNNDLYILTHPEYEQIMRERSEALIASIPTDLHPTDRRLAMVRGLQSIYASERDRKRGAPAALPDR